jgi:hypothetical protein
MTALALSDSGLAPTVETGNPSMIRFAHCRSRGVDKEQHICRMWQKPLPHPVLLMSWHGLSRIEVHASRLPESSLQLTHVEHAASIYMGPRIPRMISRANCSFVGGWLGGSPDTRSLPWIEFLVTQNFSARARKPEEKMTMRGRP